MTSLGLLSAGSVALQIAVIFEAGRASETLRFKAGALERDHARTLNTRAYAISLTKAAVVLPLQSMDRGFARTQNPLACAVWRLKLP